MENNELVLSSLGKTWIFDLDGTLVKHNGYLEGQDILLTRAADFVSKIPSEDMIVIITSRTSECREETIKFLKDKSIRYDHIIFDAPVGERILINDRKPSGLITAFAVNTERDVFMENKFTVDKGR